MWAPGDTITTPITTGSDLVLVDGCHHGSVDAVETVSGRDKIGKDTAQIDAPQATQACRETSGEVLSGV